MRLKTDKCIYVTSRVIGTMPLPWNGKGEDNFAKMEKYK